MDDLDSLIRQRQAEAERRQRDLDMFKAETRGMETVRDMGKPNDGDTSPAAMFSQDGSSFSKVVTGVPIVPIRRGGRQPGAISQQWRNILRHLYMIEANGFTEDEVVAYAMVEGIAMKLKDARDRMEKYRGQGFIESRDGKYFVTLAAGRKFGFVPPQGSFKGPIGNQDLA